MGNRWKSGVRRRLDDWFGTLARYCGLGLLIYSVAFDRFRNPALLPAATGLMFLKNITNGKGNGNGGGNGNKS